MEYTFPGLPCPPLDMLYMICTSMQSWLMIDAKNVVVLHCQGPRGRSSLVASCFLAFFYKSEFSGGAREALKVYGQIADAHSPTTLLPSQQRYLGYFDEVLHGFIPLNKPLILQRLIINGIPDVT
jgi:phosphatidylinositol-3,4,5-trisphosphate 3-phosphatase and dual-specificity protein phosphatase PTEN